MSSTARSTPRACPECASSVAMRHRSVITTPGMVRLLQVLTVLATLTAAAWLTWSHRTENPWVTTGMLSRDLKVTMTELSAIARGESDPSSRSLRERLDALLDDDAIMRQEASLMAYRERTREHRSQIVKIGWPMGFGSVSRMWQAEIGRPDFAQRVSLPEDYTDQGWTWELLGVYRSWRVDNAIVAISFDLSAPLRVGLVVCACAVVLRWVCRWWDRRRGRDRREPPRWRRRLLSPWTLVLVGLVLLLFPRVDALANPLTTGMTAGPDTRVVDLLGSDQDGASNVRIAKAVLDQLAAASSAPQPGSDAPLGETVRLVWSYRWAYSGVHLAWPTQSSFAYCSLGWRRHQLLQPATPQSPPSGGAKPPAFPAESWRFRTTNWGEWELFFPVHAGETSRFSILIDPVSVVIHAIGLCVATVLLVRLVTLLVTRRTTSRWRSVQCVQCGYDLRGIVDPADRGL